MANHIQNVDTITSYSAYTGIPLNMVTQELNGIFGSTILKELGEIIKLYQIYEYGADFGYTEDSSGVNLDLRYKNIRALIDKEARFLFSNSPDLKIEPQQLSDNSAENERLNSEISILQTLVDNVLSTNNFPDKLIKAAKDCLIGKRIACVLNFNERGIKIAFIPSLEFIFETSTEDENELVKFICFYTTQESDIKADQRIYRKKYWMDKGFCWINEGIYDGMGNLVEEKTPDTRTLFQYIPATIIKNDGLTGDTNGESEINTLNDYESWYSRLSVADIRALGKSMNPIKYTVDCDPASTTDLSLEAGAFWDLKTDETVDGRTGAVGTLESQISYSTALSSTLERIKAMMYEQLDVPNINTENMKGVITSGKTLKAIYWPLVVRCNEKMKAWKPSLKFVIDTIIEGSRLYPDFAKPYCNEPIPIDNAYRTVIDNQYPLPEDEAEEKQVDLAEIAAQTMSRKAYMMKWRNLTSDEAEAEINQIAMEKSLLEDTVMPPMDE